MGTELHDLQPPAGSRKKKKRVGRGIGSGRGKTSTRGMKGQLYRRTSMRVSFEGGQLPLHMRIPKRGFVNINRVPQHGVNVALLDEKFEAGTEVTPEVLHERGLVPKNAKVIKVLGTGDIKTALKITCHKISVTARSKVEGAGGTITLLKPVVPEGDAKAKADGKKSKRRAKARAAQS